MNRVRDRAHTAQPGDSETSSSVGAIGAYFQNTFFYLAGLLFLSLAKVKNVIQGYASPKPFDISESQRCIDYDIRVAEDWLFWLREYAQDFSLAGKTVLELGPGSDLGVGLYLLAKGCAQYNACDVSDLMSAVPDSFYEQFLDTLSNSESQETLILLQQQLSASKARVRSQLNNIVRNDFDLAAAFGSDSIDVVFSQSAFEHFDDIPATISQLHKVCKSGAVMIAQVDLKTHSRWIRPRDPNNIYRYPKALYNLFWFRGIPNRVRPLQYKEALEHNGWREVSIYPISKLEQGQGYAGMNNLFRAPKNQMDYLSIIICATHGED